MTVAPRGFVKLARRAFSKAHGDRWWLEPRTFSKWEAWIDVIQLAQFQAYTYQTEHGPIALDRGEFIASLRFLAERWKWSVKQVRGFVEQAARIDRIRAQRKTQAGTVYVVVNYETYQGEGQAEGTPTVTPEGTPRAQQGHKNKKVKKGEEERTQNGGASAPPVASPLERFPRSLCDHLYDRWLARRGGVDYGTLRKGFSLLFPASGALYTEEELLGAIDAFSEAADSAPPEFADRWTPRKCATDAKRWVRLGKMQLVNEWGEPTERGLACKLFDAA